MTESQALVAVMAFSTLVALATGSKVALWAGIGGLAGSLLYLWGGRIGH